MVSGVMPRASEGPDHRSAVGSIADLQQRLASQHYVADRGLAVSVFLALRLGRPLFLEGEAGVGKTSLAGAVAAALGADLIRLQCYEGLDISHAVYEWDYARQLLELRILDAAGTVNRDEARHELYSETFLIKRPLLEVAIDNGINIEHACGSVCACSTCHIYLEQGSTQVNEATEAEEDRVEEAPGIRRSSRLACQCELNNLGDGKRVPSVIRVPSWNRNAVKEIPH